MKKLLWNVLTTFALAGFLLAAGCGYSTVRSSIPGQAATVFIPAFTNETFEPGLQVPVTNTVIREFRNEGWLSVVGTVETADLVVRGVLVDFETRALSFDQFDNVIQRRVVLSSNITVENPKTKEVLWTDTVKGLSFYQVAGGRTRAEALDEAAENLAEEIVHRTLDNVW